MIPHVDLRIENCEAEVWLNDFPIHRVTATDSPKFVTMPVSEFVHNGENILTLIPLPGATPSTSRESRLERTLPAASIEAKLVFYELGDFPGSGAGKDAIIAVLKPSEGTALSIAQPIVQGLTLNIGVGSWAWQHARPLSLTAEVREMVTRAVYTAHKAFAERDADFFLKFGHIYFAEYAKAYPELNQETREQRFRAGLAGRPGDPSWRIAPLNESAFALRLCANGRLIELIDREFRPILRSESKFYPFQMFVGYLDGRLQMLR